MTETSDTRRASKAKPSSALEVVRYAEKGETDPIDFRIDASSESIWATQAQIVALFQTDQSGISRHLKSIFEEEELDRENNMQKMHIAGSNKPVTVYSLDAVISVGYRVNSKVATKFRQWATGTLKAYVEQGYIINERVLRDSPEKLNKLAREVRALRSGEKQIYAKVRECFKISASDYDKSSRTVRSFYALLTDKFLHAVTNQTSSKLVLDRADHLEDFMGLQTFEGKEPKANEVSVGKNYLNGEELYRLHLLSEQFLLFAESTALAGKKMTMASLHEQLDRLLQLNDYPVFEGYKDFLKDDAGRHAKAELELYRVRKKVEAKGIEYDETSYLLGEYDQILKAA
ncbi:RhuM family protein [Pseudophaeobacter sp.]|uniref:RhuM family protein n=1 Tax=Pseudophaeobacter sp. TaxID=1971739 RepID=UPI00326815BE